MTKVGTKSIIILGDRVVDVGSSPTLKCFKKSWGKDKRANPFESEYGATKVTSCVDPTACDGCRVGEYQRAPERS